MTVQEGSVHSLASRSILNASNTTNAGVLLVSPDFSVPAQGFSIFKVHAHAYTRTHTQSGACPPMEGP